MMQTEDGVLRGPGNDGKVLLDRARWLLRLLPRIARLFWLTDLPRRVADRIRLEQVNVLSTLVGVMSVMGQGAVLLVVYEFWDTGARTMLAPVEATIFSCYVALVGISLRWNGLWKGFTDSTAEEVRSWYVRVASVLGLAWGVLFIGLMPFGQADQRSLLYGLIVGSISAGALIVPVSAALAFWAPITMAALIATTVTTNALDSATAVLLAGYGVLTLFCMLYLNRVLILRALGEIEHQDGQETISLLLRDFEEAACDWLWETDEDGLLTHVSDRFAQVTQREPRSLFGMTFAEILGLPASLATDAGQPATGGLPALAALMERRLPFRDFEVCLQVGAEVMWWSLTGKPKFAAQRVFEGYRGVGSDITHVKRANDRARFLAHYDELTGLANRRLFRETLDARFRAAEAPPIALLCLDLDRFKAVNDTRGHPTGDQLLVAVARRLERQVRAGDLCARLGGDEFAIVLWGADAALARAIADRIVVEVSRAYAIDGHQLDVGVSIGIAMACPAATSYEALLKDADAALYQAKANGRGLACFHSHALHEYGGATL
jgi:diguanylate cyclase (GGDEF)-like protein